MTDELNANSGQAAALSAYVLCDAFFRGALTAEDYQRTKAAFERELSSVELAGRSPSFVLDYIGACHAAAAVASACGDGSFAAKMEDASRAWKGVYDAGTGLLSANGSFYEGDNRNYSFRPHPHMGERVALAGGQERFRSLLDDFFCVGYKPDPGEPVQPDRRRGIADYMPEFTRERPLRPGHFEGLCNETDMDAPYAYLWCGRADRLAEVIDLVRRCRFSDGEGGCPGNNDAGSLGSWYVWSCLGLYPMTGTPHYLLGSPSVESAELQFAKGMLKIKVERTSPTAIYPIGCRFNGREVLRPSLPVSEVEKGGGLVFVLADKPVDGRWPPPECF
jgi:putative alpha-1,2-mannosidase